MFKNLLSSLRPTGKSGQAETAPATLDISRVIKPARAPESEMTLETRAAPAMLSSSVAPDMAEDIASRAESAVDSLADQFETWMRTDLEHLVGAWQRAKADSNPEHYRGVFTAAHNIRGAANAYGYPAISRLCGSLSRLLTETRPGENTALINLHVEACRAAFNSIGQGSDGQSVADAVCEALEERVALKVANA